MFRSIVGPAWVAGVVITAAGLAGCGSSSGGGGTGSASTPAATSTAEEPAAPAPIELTIERPSDGAVVHSGTVRVAGTVTPTTAAVSVDGRRAPVSGGHWVKTVRGLKRGENSVDVDASAAGRDDASLAITVTRNRSAAEIAAAVAARKERERRRAEARRLAAQQKEANFRASAKHLDYRQLVKNPERYDGAHVVFSGPILQIRDEGGSGFMLLQTSCDEFDICDDLVYVEFDRSIRSAADDRVTVYGTITGGYSYDTQAGGSNFVPKMHLRYIDE